MADSIFLSALRQTPLSSTIATQDWALSTFTETSVTFQLSSEIVDGLSNTVIPKLDIITGLVSAEVDKLDELSAQLSAVDLAKESGQVLAISVMSNNDITAINLTKNKYVYRFTDDLSSGAFPRLVAPTDVLTPTPYYFTFEIEWTTNTSLASYPQSFDWINYPEIVLDGAFHTYCIAGRWDSSGSGTTAFTMNCWRVK